MGGEELAVELLEEQENSFQAVYNLEVSGTHNYYVSSPSGKALDLLVHNCDNHDCNAVTSFGDTAQEMYNKLGVGAVAACALSAAGCAGSLVTPGGQVFAAGACPASMPFCELAAASLVAGTGTGLLNGVLKNEMQKGESGSGNKIVLDRFSDRQSQSG